MEFYVVDSYRELSDKAANIVAEEMFHNKNAVLGLATGSTPEGMYARLVKMYRESKLDFASIVTFNLDEYIGLCPEHPRSYHYYMNRNLFDHVNINAENINIPCCSDGWNSGEICREYDRKIINAGGIDLQLLGLGVNGHIGFNEPGQHLQAQTHLVNLAKETIEANSRFFDTPDEVPRQAITMGVGSIMHSAKILLMASGQNKAPAIRESFSGLVSTKTPASLLQLHRDLILLIDKEAASLLDCVR